jgi:hypothetical protein
MQVNVFVARAKDQLHNKLLVLPLSPQAAIPAQYRKDWKYYATVDTGDRMFGDIDALAIEAEIASIGFALVKPRGPVRI